MFEKWRKEQAKLNWANHNLRSSAENWHTASRKAHYQYMATSCGLPIIQDPQDVCILSDIIWDKKPDLIIATGIARGGSIVHHAHALAALNQIDIQNGIMPNRKVLGIDIDIRTETKNCLANHPLNFMFETFEGTSVGQETIDAVRQKAFLYNKVMVVLDSNHTEEHVTQELYAYSEFVTQNMPLFVMDTGIEFAPEESFSLKRPWSKGSNPYTSVEKFIKSTVGSGFIIDTSYQERYIITSSPDGLLIKR
jgi:cephalosporin hydroxylase